MRKAFYNSFNLVGWRVRLFNWLIGLEFSWVCVAVLVRVLVDLWGVGWYVENSKEGKASYFSVCWFVDLLACLFIRYPDGPIQ